jgi:hypothetical protein
MPSGVVKAIVLVSDLDEVLGFVENVAGVKPVKVIDDRGGEAARVLGWPQEHGATRCAIVGSRQGFLECIEIPAALRDSVQPGLVTLSYAALDVEGGATKAEAAGYAVDGPHDVTAADGSISTHAQVVAGGIAFELIRFAT